MTKLFDDVDIPKTIQYEFATTQFGSRPLERAAENLFWSLYQMLEDHPPIKEQWIRREKVHDLVDREYDEIL